MKRMQYGRVEMKECNMKILPHENVQSEKTVTSYGCSSEEYIMKKVQNKDRWNDCYMEECNIKSLSGKSYSTKKCDMQRVQQEKNAKGKKCNMKNAAWKKCNMQKVRQEKNAKGQKGNMKNAA